MDERRYQEEARVYRYSVEVSDTGEERKAYTLEDTFDCHTFAYTASNNPTDYMLEKDVSKVMLAPEGSNVQEGDHVKIDNRTFYVVEKSQPRHVRCFLALVREPDL